jgi:hypothetical protein
MTTLRQNRRTLLFGVLLGLSLLPVWITAYPPLQDYPDWLLQAQILRRFHDPEFSFAQYYSILSVPLPNAGAVIVIYLLGAVLPMEVAGKAALSLYLLAFPLSIVFFLRSVHSRASALEFAALLFAYNVFFYLCYLGYLFALALLFLVLAYLWRRWSQLTFIDLSLLAVSAVVILLMHPIPWATLIFVVGSWLILELRDRGWKKLVGVTLALLPSVLVLAVYLGSTGGGLSITRYPSLALKFESYLEPLLLAFEVQPWRSPYPSTTVNFVIWIGLGLLAAIALKDCLRTARLSKTAALEPTFAAGALGLWVITLVSPLWVSDLLRPDERLVIPLLVVSVAAVRWPKPAWRYDASLIVFCLLALVVNTGTFMRGGRELATLVEDFSQFVTANQHPFFLPVPCERPQWAGLHLPTIVDAGSRAGFYWTIRRGGDNQQILPTRIVRLRDPSGALPERRPAFPAVPLSDPRDDLGRIAEFLTANVLGDYRSVALIGCPEFARKMAGLLSPSFQIPAAQRDIRSPYLTMLERAY